MASNNKAEIKSVESETPDTIRIKKLEAESRRYPFSPVFQETIQLLKKQIKPVTEQVVTITMPRDQAEKLYGLLGQITAHSGFDPIFQSLDKADFTLRRQRPKMHFVRDNTLHAEF